MGRFKAADASSFQFSQAGTLHEQFFAIGQSGTARDYITMFEKMVAQLPRLQEEVLEGIFIKGLKQELRTAVRTQKPTGLSQAMELALIIDETSKSSQIRKLKGFAIDVMGSSFQEALQLLLVDDDEEEEIEGGYDEEHEVVFQGGGDDMNPLTWSIVNYVSQRN
ncbi:ankyrin repeat-containing protein [Tanacetum coccineum]